ncbi:hypothetical protein AB0L82_35655 [Nocardia sp. NPDC052001]|uniref:hypothetical protein n=1 Tax=Nocardia sp. NPDC052001 TaxID=3154853 RepID=UPI003441F387
MGTFAIEFTDASLPAPAADVRGTLTLGDEVEYFKAPTDYWNLEHYRASWSTALHRIVTGHHVSCLITSIHAPDSAAIVQVWPLYLDGAVVHVQHQLIFLGQPDISFDPAAPWESVPPRATVNDDGDRISEWSVPVVDIGDFLRHADTTHRP